MRRTGDSAGTALNVGWLTYFWIEVDQLYLIKIFCAGLMTDVYLGLLMAGGGTYPCARGPVDIAL